jgi:alkylation response protein AidB-like acyl-CoA dehydrogenase
MGSIPVERGRPLGGTPPAALRGVKASLNIMWTLRSQCPIRGSPEAGTLMVARRLTTIPPAMALPEALEITRIPCVAGRTGAPIAVVTTRPCRAPHHTIAAVGLIGGGQVPLPVPEALQIRLDCARLATAAVALEAKKMGGRGYVVTTPTARRLREAAFLPIQAPTEGQLRWEMARCRLL